MVPDDAFMVELVIDFRVSILVDCILRLPGILINPGNLLSITFLNDPIGRGNFNRPRRMNSPYIRHIDKTGSYFLTKS